MKLRKFPWLFAGLIAAGAAAGALVPARADNPNMDLGPAIILNNQAAGTTFSADLRNPSGHAAKCTVNITAIAAGSLTITIYGKDGVSGQYYTLLASAALASPGQTVLTVGPGLTIAGNTVANDYLPPTWRVGATVATGPASATVGCVVVE